MMRLRWPLLGIGALGTLYALILLTIRITDLGLWLILLSSLPPLLWGIFPGRVRRFCRTRFGRVIKWLLIAGYSLFILSFVPIACTIASYAADAPDPGADAVIVLGGGLWGGKPAPALAKRLEVGLTYANDNPDCLVVVSGGQGPDEPRTEASAMAEYLMERGLPEGRLVLEEGSYSTYDNFRLSKLLLDERLPEGYRVVFVTSDFHILRSTQLAQAEGLNAQGLASPSDPFYIPCYYVREYLVVLKYLLFGAESMPWLSRLF